MRRDVFQGLADPTRRAIVLLLAANAMTPNAIAEHFGSSRQAVSKHIQILVACDLLTQQQQGREIHYQVNAGKMQDVEKWIAQFNALLVKRFAQLDDVLEQLKTTKE